MAKYTAAQAAAKARQIFDRFGSRIAEVCAGTPVSEDFLGGFVGVEAGVAHGQISETATRFEPGVFHHLQLVRNGFAHSWSKITTLDLKGATDDALRNLATSYGLTQIMGWHVIHDLACTVNDLRDPDKHLAYAVQLLQIDGGSWLRQKNWGAVLHIWNSGTPTGRTYDPDYVQNALAVKAAYAKLLAGGEPPAVISQEDPDTSAAAPAQDVAAAAETSSEQSSSLPDQPPVLDQQAVGGGVLDKFQTAANRFDTVNNAVSGVTSHGDAVKALWASVTHATLQPVWAVFAFIFHMPWWMWLGVAGFVALTYVMYHHRQLVMGKIRETLGLGAPAAEPANVTATSEVKVT